MKNSKKVKSIILSCIIMVGIMAMFSPMTGAAAKTTVVSKGKEVYSRYDPGSNKGETSDGIREHSQMNYVELLKNSRVFTFR